MLITSYICSQNKLVPSSRCFIRRCLTSDQSWNDSHLGKSKWKRSPKSKWKRSPTNSLHTSPGSLQVRTKTHNQTENRCFLQLPFFSQQVQTGQSCEMLKLFDKLPDGNCDQNCAMPIIRFDKWRSDGASTRGEGN